MKKYMYMLSSLIVVVLLMACSNKAEKIIEKNLISHFDNFEGSFILLDEKDSSYTVFNKEGVNTQVPPCSTYKIFHALIGLETGNITLTDSIKKWDGKKYGIESWNKNHELDTAIQNSVVWYFKDLASDIGEEKTKEYLELLKYGNQDISGGQRKYWLQSTLKISPKEQVDLLQSFHSYQLEAFNREYVDYVKESIKLDDKENAILYGKTGTGMMDDEAINGWFIGFVETEDNTYYYATNIQAAKGAYSSKAKEITLSILEELEVY